MQHPFTPDTFLSAIAIAYRNTDLIADEVMPRSPVDKYDFAWTKYDIAERFTIPSTLVGRKSRPNQIDYKTTEEKSSVEDYGLDSPVPQADISNAKNNYSPLAHAAEATTDLILLDREVRVANMVFNTKNYSASNQKTLSGATQWSNDSSSPLTDISSALDSMIVRANVLVLGNDVASRLCQHPKVVRAFNGSTGEDGIVPIEFLREILRLEQIHIGTSWVNMIKPGKEPVLQRVWGNHASLLYVNKNATTQSGVTWGLTAQFGDRVSGTIPEPNMGLRGGQMVRVGESVKEICVAKHAGYFFQNAIA